MPHLDAQLLAICLLTAGINLIGTLAYAARIAGILLVPTGQRLFARAIGWFQEHRSTTRMLLASATPAGLRTMRDSLALPTVGVLASLYAGYLNPEFRVTASQLSAVINGLATILLFALIDPQLSVMTDDVVEGRVSEPLFRRTIVWISFSRLAGTLLAQALFLPSAMAIAWVANYV